MNAAMQIEQKRRDESLAQHKARIEWLEAPAPKWADGVAVKPSDRHMMLVQSKQIVDFHAKHFGSAA